MALWYHKSNAAPLFLCKVFHKGKLNTTTKQIELLIFRNIALRKATNCNANVKKDYENRVSCALIVYKIRRFAEISSAHFIPSMCIIAHRRCEKKRDINISFEYCIIWANKEMNECNFPWNLYRSLAADNIKWCTYQVQWMLTLHSTTTITTMTMMTSKLPHTHRQNTTQRKN